MSYTRIAVPSSGFKITSALVLRMLIGLIGIATFGSLIVNYVSVDRANRALALKLNTYAGTKPVAAIKKPEQIPDRSQALIPVDRDEVQGYLEKIQSMVIVPTDEAPSLATVVSTESLRGEVFFRNVVLQDKLFLYDTARIAILYRPSEQKIVNMAYLAEGATESPKSAPMVRGESTQSATLTTPMSVAVYYATDSASLRSRVGDALRAIADVTVAQEALARQSSYTGLTLVDITGTNGARIQTLADTIGGTIGTMPATEDVPDADILVIVGE